MCSKIYIAQVIHITKTLQTFVQFFVFILVIHNCKHKVEPHLLPIPSDNDNDYLTDSIETKIYLYSCDPQKADTDGDGILDGPQLAFMFYSVIDTLPKTVQNYAVYALYHYETGNDTCPICQAVIPRGTVHVVNPICNSDYTMPLLALHFLEFGGLRYKYKNGEIGDIDPIKLLNVISTAD